MKMKKKIGRIARALTANMFVVGIGALAVGCVAGVVGCIVG